MFTSYKGFQIFPYKISRKKKTAMATGCLTKFTCKETPWLFTSYKKFPFCPLKKKISENKNCHGLLNKIIGIFYKETPYLFTSYKGFQICRWKKSYKKKNVTVCLTKKYHFFEKKYLGCSLLKRGFQFARWKKSYKKKN